MLTYTIVLISEPDGSAVNVRIPAMPGVFTWGTTPDEAVAAAREAIALHLEGYVERHEPYPRDRQPGPADGLESLFEDTSDRPGSVQTRKVEIVTPTGNDPRHHPRLDRIAG